METVTAYGRAKRLFDFDHVWEVCKPVEKRRWGYYTLPILFGDQLVARIDPKLERDSGLLAIKGFWVEDAKKGEDPQFAEALARGMIRLASFLDARRVDISSLKPTGLRKMIHPAMREYTRQAKDAPRLSALACSI